MQYKRTSIYQKMPATGLIALITFSIISYYLTEIRYLQYLHQVADVDSQSLRDSFYNNEIYVYLYRYFILAGVFIIVAYRSLVAYKLFH